MHHWLCARAWYRSSLTQIVCILARPKRSADTIKWESLLCEQTHTQELDNICSSRSHVVCASEARSYQCPSPSNLSYLRSCRINLTPAVWVTVSNELTAGYLPSWHVRNVACSAVDNTWSARVWLCVLFVLGVVSSNRPVVQECVSCLVRGLQPSGIHAISFPTDGSGVRHSQAHTRTALDSQHVRERWTKMIIGFFFFRQS